MNLLTRTVLEDLFKLNVSLVKKINENSWDDNVYSDVTPAPGEIILKIIGLDSETHADLFFEVIEAVYYEKITITEAINRLEQERELVL